MRLTTGDIFIRGNGIEKLLAGNGQSITAGTNSDGMAYVHVNAPGAKFERMNPDTGKFEKINQLPGFT